MYATFGYLHASPVWQVSFPFISRHGPVNNPVVWQTLSSFHSRKPKLAPMMLPHHYHITKSFFSPGFEGRGTKLFKAQKFCFDHAKALHLTHLCKSSFAVRTLGLCEQEGAKDSCTRIGHVSKFLFLRHTKPKVQGSVHMAAPQDCISHCHEMPQASPRNDLQRLHGACFQPVLKPKRRCKTGIIWREPKTFQPLKSFFSHLITWECTTSPTSSERI